MGDIIIEQLKKRATENTVYHALYGYYFLGLTKTKLAKIYRKHISTITSWVSKYAANGFFSRKKYERDVKKFGVEKIDWILKQYEKKPTLFLGETKQMFEQTFGLTISASTVCRILHHAGLTWKTIERRAIQIRSADIVRYWQELASLLWDFHCLLFLDEVSFDNRTLLRNKGYCMQGERLVCTGEFLRKPRVSLLCFLGQNGMTEVYDTEGTFNRTKFFECVQKFIRDNNVERYPGANSIWIMDGARIHCDPMIIYYLRSLGLIPIFLPAYCPMYNPIEIVFGLVKDRLRFLYRENSKQDIKIVIAEVLQTFCDRSMENLFRHCGYIRGGKFDPTKRMHQNVANLSA